MNITYFNYAARIAEGRWDRRDFAHKWWHIYDNDPRWVPPYYPTLRRALEPAKNSHLARMSPIFISLEALPRRRSLQQDTQMYATAAFEEPVAATVALCDPRRRDGTAYLAYLRCANDPESLDRLLMRLAEELWATGCRRVIGPTGLSPRLGTGLLQDYWNELPPLHTAYNPPYLPELVSGTLRPLGRSQLYHLDVPDELPPPPPAPAALAPLESARLTTDLLPLLEAACPAWAGFPPPDEAEVAFLSRWLRQWPLHGWLAQIDEQPVGVVLLQPDLAPQLHRANGGRNPIWRLWLKWASRRPARHGRVLFGGVLPEWREQGIGRQLLHQALVTGREQGWQTLTIGPLPTAAPARGFLEHHGAHPRQTYLLYQRDL